MLHKFKDAFPARCDLAAYILFLGHSELARQLRVAISLVCVLPLSPARACRPLKKIKLIVNAVENRGLGRITVATESLNWTSWALPFGCKASPRSGSFSVNRIIVAVGGYSKC